MGDGKLEIETRINSDKISNDINGLKNKLNKITGSNILKSVIGLGSAFATVTTAIKLTNKTIKETSEAYRVQAKAEKQLEAAAKNNPYLDQKAVKELKDFAGEMQKISTVGDEQLIPMMSQLAAAGRTQSEIQKIMQAALDVSATGTLSLDSAVQQLNASYSGNVGMLGRQISELKTLTKEELESGKAVEIIAQKFKGVSKEVADATGSTEQLQNAWGDLKEELGYGFEKALTPVRKYFTKLVSDIANAKKELREEKTGSSNYDKGEKESQNIEAKISQTEKLLAIDEKTLKYDEGLNKAQMKRAGITEEQLNQLRDSIQTKKDELEVLKEELRIAQDQEKQKQDEVLAEEKAKTLAEEKAQRDADALKFMNENQAALDKQIEQIKLEAELKGEDADQQEILNAMMQSYIDLVTGSDLVTENNPFSQRRLAELQQYAETIPVDKFAELKEALSEISDDGGKSVLDSLKDQLTQLDNLAEGLDKETELYKEYANKRKVLEEEITQTQKENLAEQFENINSYMSQFSDITQNMTSLIRSANEKETEEELTDLSKQYTDGLISYEEYCDKKEQIDKQAAQKEYKLKMWEWSASLLTATSNIAQGISKAIADGGVAGIISGALVGVAGAVQIATLMANKPKPPSFATGGFLTGNSTHGDKIAFKGNAGESILNPAEMRTFMAMANGEYKQSGSVVNMPVKIENNASGEVSASAKMTQEGLRVTIDKMVNSSMIQGRYNQSMTLAENKKSGVAIL